MVAYQLPKELCNLLCQAVEWLHTSYLKNYATCCVKRLSGCILVTKELCNLLCQALERLHIGY